MCNSERLMPELHDVLLPKVRKTPHMLEIERVNGGLDVRLLIKSIYEETGSQKAVARRLGLEQSTVTVWALRLGITFIRKPTARIEV